MFQIKVLFLAVIAIFVIANAHAKQIEIQPRIINGQDVERGQFPFYVYLEVLTSSFIIVNFNGLFYMKMQHLQNITSVSIFSLNLQACVVQH